MTTPQLFKRWITQSVSLKIISWIVIYSVDSSTQHLDMGARLQLPPKPPSMPLNLKFVMGDLRPNMAVVFTGIS